MWKCWSIQSMKRAAFYLMRWRKILKVTFNSIQNFIWMTNRHWLFLFEGCVSCDLDYFLQVCFHSKLVLDHSTNGNFKSFDSFTLILQMQSSCQAYLFDFSFISSAEYLSDNRNGMNVSLYTIAQYQLNATMQSQTSKYMPYTSNESKLCKLWYNSLSIHSVSSTVLTVE